MNKKNRIPVILLITEIILLVISLILAREKLTWVLEVFPILIGLPVLIFSYRRFQLTNFLYTLLIIHSVILMVGGIYTYAKVPLGFWMQDWFGFARNHYDRIGHFAQGFFPAIIIREFMLRKSPLKRGGLLVFITISICLAISALYELIEFGYTVSIGESSESFLGSQGDIWDAQWDMLFALIGSICALIVLPKIHDKFLKEIDNG
jgi:putative membrane protein